MIVREFDKSKEDTQEVIEMFVDLMNYDNDETLTYAEYVGELYKLLYMKGSKCFICTTADKVAGFAIMYPDNQGGIVGQSLYLKEEYRGTMLFGKFLKWLEKFTAQGYEYCTLIATNEHICKVYDKKYIKQHTIYKYIPEGA